MKRVVKVNVNNIEHTQTNMIDWNTEPVTVVSTNEGSWVATIDCAVIAWGASPDANARVTLMVNNIAVNRLYLPGGTTRAYACSPVLVSKGDTVTIQGEYGTFPNIGFYYVPMKQAKFQNDYYLSEVDTGNVWIDGRNIYKKSYCFTLNENISEGDTILELQENFITDATLVLQAESVIAQKNTNTNARWTGGNRIEVWTNQITGQTGVFTLSAINGGINAQTYPVNVVVTVYYVK